VTRADGAQAARVGLATCAALPWGDDDETALTQALKARGVHAPWLVWSDVNPTTVHEDVDLVVIRNTWDYINDQSGFLSWVEACSVPVLNAPETIRWNSDKRYMLDLAAAGVPSVPTLVVDSTEVEWQPPVGYEEIVVKPAIGVGSRGAQRFFADTEMDEARAHALSLVQAGNSAIVQPYLPSVDAGSETALIHIDGEFTHAITKGQMLRRDGGGQWVEGLYLQEDIQQRTASEQQLVVARAAFEAVPEADLLYARVDLVDDPDGAPVVLELELIEPSLFLAFEPSTANVLAEAILRRL